MPQHPLKRVVQLVGDARDELPQRRQFFRLGQSIAQLDAFGLQSRLLGHVAGHDHRADAFVVPADQRADREQERAPSTGSCSSRDSDSLPPPASGTGPRRSTQDTEIGAEELGQRVLDEIGGAASKTRRQTPDSRASRVAGCR